MSRRKVLPGQGECPQTVLRCEEITTLITSIWRASWAGILGAGFLLAIATSPAATSYPIPGWLSAVRLWPGVKYLRKLW